jgi:DNA-3-methyladenine glycosylase II
MPAQIDTTAALEYFKTNDPIMHGLLEAALSAEPPMPVPAPRPAEHHFDSIVTAIIGQQISTKAADSVRRRTSELLGDPISPERVLATPSETLQACGLSGQKTRYIVENAQRWHTLPTDNFQRHTDAEMIRLLTELKGIGRWTAEMFLIFSLARPDVFSYGDLGLMQSIYQHYGFYPHYTRKIRQTVESWSPHRSTAALALWHERDNR